MAKKANIKAEPHIPRPRALSPQEMAERRRRSDEDMVRGTAGRQLWEAVIAVADGADEIEVDTGTHILTISVSAK